MKSGNLEKYPRWLKGHPWKGCRSLIAARGFKSLLLRSIWWWESFDSNVTDTWQLDFCIFCHIENSTLTNKQQCDPEDSKKRRRAWKRGKFREKEKRTITKQRSSKEGKGPGWSWEGTQKGNFSPLGSKGPHQAEPSKFLPGSKGPHQVRDLKTRVRSWLRMNAGGVPNTCKSNGDILEWGFVWRKMYLSGGRVSNAWATYRIQGDNT